MDSPTHAGPGLADVPLLFADHQLVDVVLVELVEDEKDVVHRPPRSTFLLFLRACSHKGFLVIVAERIPGGGGVIALEVVAVEDVVVDTEADSRYEIIVARAASEA